MDDRPEFDALGYLQAVYRGEIVAEGPRMKAAIEALPFEKPKLSASANVHSFALQMEEMSRIRGKSNVIDASANHNGNVFDAKTDHRAEQARIDANRRGLEANVALPIQTDPTSDGRRGR